jgi:hypothetical protein
MPKAAITSAALTDEKLVNELVHWGSSGLR